MEPNLLMLKILWS